MQKEILENRIPWMAKAPISHRGLHQGTDIPENSLLAFKKAKEKQYSIELDVQITKDNQIIVFHDEDLHRLCSIQKKVIDENYEDLKEYKLYDTNETIPLLSDVLKLIDGKVALIIEIKNFGKVGLFEELLSKELDNYSGQFAICSFNVEVVNWFKSYKSDFRRGLIFGDVREYGIRFYKTVFLYRILISKPDFISLDYNLLDTFIPKICRFFNKPLVSWTINSKEKLEKAKRKVDNIIFENIEI